MAPVERDQRLPNRRSPDEAVSLAQLERLGVRYAYVEPAGHDTPGTASHGALQSFREEQGFRNSDVLNVSPSTLPDYEKKLAAFFEEHIHEDPEVRYVLDGSGYFDVRDDADEWVRVAVEAGDLIVLPMGIYHRFTLDEREYIRAERLFRDLPKWVPINRPAADEHPARASYLAQQRRMRQAAECAE